MALDNAKGVGSLSSTLTNSSTSTLSVENLMYTLSSSTITTTTTSKVSSSSLDDLVDSLTAPTPTEDEFSILPITKPESSTSLTTEDGPWTTVITPTIIPSKSTSPSTTNATKPGPSGCSECFSADVHLDYYYAVPEQHAEDMNIMTQTIVPVLYPVGNGEFSTSLSTIFAGNFTDVPGAARPTGNTQDFWEGSSDNLLDELNDARITISDGQYTFQGHTFVLSSTYSVATAPATVEYVVPTNGACATKTWIGALDGIYPAAEAKQQVIEDINSALFGAGVPTPTNNLFQGQRESCFSATKVASPSASRPPLIPIPGGGNGQAGGEADGDNPWQPPDNGGGGDNYPGKTEAAESTMRNAVFITQVTGDAITYAGPDKTPEPEIGGINMAPGPTSKPDSGAGKPGNDNADIGRPGNSEGTDKPQDSNGGGQTGGGNNGGGNGAGEGGNGNGNDNGNGNGGDNSNGGNAGDASSGSNQGNADNNNSGNGNANTGSNNGGNGGSSSGGNPSPDTKPSPGFSDSILCGLGAKEKCHPPGYNSGNNSPSQSSGDSGQSGSSSSNNDNNNNGGSGGSGNSGTNNNDSPGANPNPAAPQVQILTLPDGQHRTMLLPPPLPMATGSTQAPAPAPAAAPAVVVGSHTVKLPSGTDASQPLKTTWTEANGQVLTAEAISAVGSAGAVVVLYDGSGGVATVSAGRDGSVGGLNVGLAPAVTPVPGSGGADGGDGDGDGSAGGNGSSDGSAEGRTMVLTAPGGQVVTATIEGAPEGTLAPSAVLEGEGIGTVTLQAGSTRTFDGWVVGVPTDVGSTGGIEVSGVEETESESGEGGDNGEDGDDAENAGQDGDVGNGEGGSEGGAGEASSEDISSSGASSTRKVVLGITLASLGQSVIWIWVFAVGVSVGAVV